MKTPDLFFRFFRRFSLLLTVVAIFFMVHSGSTARAADGDFVWARSMGGILEDLGNDIFVDSAGNVYTTGWFNGTVDFDPGTSPSETYKLTSKGSSDIFISKLNSSGNFVWARAIGGDFADVGYDIFVDSSGNVYTTGSFNGTVDFDPGPGTPYNLTSASAGFGDIFISKLNSSGNFVWAKAMGGTLADFGNNISVDSSGNVYTTGYFQNTVDFDPGTGTTYNLTSAGFEDIFISKLDSNGNFVWARAMEGTLVDIGEGVAVDSSGNVYTTGSFRGTVDFDPGPGTPYNLISNGFKDIFISKLDSSGNFVWAKAMGDFFDDVGYSITIDSDGNVLTAGYFQGTVDFDPGAGIYNLESKGAADIFISKLNSSGNFIWARAMGGTAQDLGFGISVDSSGNVYTTGYFQNIVDFNPGGGVYNLNSVNGTYDIFISKLNSSGNFVWAKAMGWTLADAGEGVTVDSDGNVYTTGYFHGTVDFNPGGGVYNLTSVNGTFDIFISKLSGPGGFPWPMFLPAIINNAKP